MPVFFNLTHGLLRILLRHLPVKFWSPSFHIVSKTFHSLSLGSYTQCEEMFFTSSLAQSTPSLYPHEHFWYYVSTPYSVPNNIIATYFKTILNRPFAPILRIIYSVSCRCLSLCTHTASFQGLVCRNWHTNGDDQLCHFFLSSASYRHSDF